MRRTIILFAIAVFFFACNDEKQSTQEVKNEVSPELMDANEADPKTLNLEEQATALKEQGHQIFIYEFEGQKYLMQEYYIVFLKAGENTDQDSLETARLMEQHLSYLTRMSEEGYASLTGPFGDDGEVRGIVVYNTPTLEEADSLARMDPMVRAGRLEVEVHPWWTEKGGQLR